MRYKVERKIQMKRSFILYVDNRGKVAQALLDQLSDEYEEATFEIVQDTQAGVTIIGKNASTTEIFSFDV